MKASTLSGLLSARRQHHASINRLPNVIGTAVGYKRRGGKKTRRPSLVVYVRNKVAEPALQPGYRIPRSLRCGGKSIALDVYGLGDLQYQFGAAPWFCRDRTDNQGSVTALCRYEASGKVYALTCAHCIEGNDRNPATPGPISLWDPSRRDYFTVGVSGAHVNTSGFGLPGNFGFSDWGLFSVDESSLIDVASRSAPLPLGSTQEGTYVSAMTAHGPVHGSIAHLNAQIADLFVDLAIEIHSGSMFSGDSGTLWRDSNGGAVAIHAIGMKDPRGSAVSFCMVAPRIWEDLASIGVTMLDV